MASNDDIPDPDISLINRARTAVAAARRLHDRERARIREEISNVPGLMALLMKPRNGQLWTANERRELRARLLSMGRLGLYFAALAVPGTAATLPLLAWWLDRRTTPRVIVRRDQHSSTEPAPE